MEVLRETKIETDRFEIGDRILVKFKNEEHYATAIQREENGALFLLDDCLDKPQPMNKERTTEGGYEASYMRKYLQDISGELPEELKSRIVKTEDGDLLRLLSLREVFGLDEDYEDTEGQIPWMADRRHRVTVMKDANYAHWWLRDVVSASYFARVNGHGGAHCGSASGAWVGVRPAFAISDL